MRLDVIKKNGFPEETCPKCGYSGEDCSLCQGSGRFIQRMCPDWQYPELQQGQKLVAIIDWDEWCYCGIVNDLGQPVAEVAFPFCTEFATDNHFQTLGFEVQRT